MTYVVRLDKDLTMWWGSVAEYKKKRGYEKESKITTLCLEHFDTEGDAQAAGHIACKLRMRLKHKLQDTLKFFEL